MLEVNVSHLQESGSIFVHKELNAIVSMKAF